MSIDVGKNVKLRVSVPELELPDGQVGTVCATWFSPAAAFEVEFRFKGQNIRALLLKEQLELVV